MADNVNDVSCMFPDIDRNIIMRDLEMTCNSEATINRILDGQLGCGAIIQDHNGSPTLNAEAFKGIQSNSYQPKSTITFSDEELPDLEINCNQLAASTSSKIPDHVDRPAKNKFIFKKKDNTEKQAIYKTHDISSDSSESDSFSPKELVWKSRLVKSPSKDLLVKYQLPDLDNEINSTKTAVGNAVSTSQNASTNYTVNIESQSTSTESVVKLIQDGAKIKKKRTTAEVDESKRQAMVLKEQAKQKREEKKREQEFEKQKRRALLEARKNAKPGECLKHMTAVISPGVLTEKCGTAILDTLQKNNIKYDVQSQVHNNIITFWREVTEVNETSDMKLDTITTEKVEDTILLLLPVLQFVNLVYNYKQKQLGLSCQEDLHDHIIDIKNSLEGRDVTVLIQGLEKYFRDQKTKGNRAFKKQVQGVDGQPLENKKRKKKSEDEIIISRMDVEEALVHLQLNDGCNIRFAELELDMGKLVLNYAKAVAETPFKRDRLDTGFTFHLESSRSVHVEKDGVGLAKVWRQQLQQFSMVTAEVANAIIAVYPSPHTLYKAYQESDSKTKGEKLLENIEVRRGAGVMATTRRVGKELSRRLYQYLTTADPEFVIT